ncbi:MAG: hypothetical protein ACKVPX_10125 [Myxococcaceae bacterium]
MTSPIARNPPRPSPAKTASPARAATALDQARELIDGANPNFDAAVALLSDWMTRGESAEALLLRAQAHEAAVRVKRARRDLRAACTLAPDSLDTHLSLARVLARMGDFEEAFDVIEAAQVRLEQRPTRGPHQDFEEACIGSAGGHILYLMGRDEDALNQWRIFPHDVSTNFLAAYEVPTKRSGAVFLSPEVAFAHVLLAEGDVLREDPERALARIRFVLECTRPHPRFKPPVRRLLEAIQAPELAKEVDALLFKLDPSLPRSAAGTTTPTVAAPQSDFTQPVCLSDDSLHREVDTLMRAYPPNLPTALALLNNALGPIPGKRTRHRVFQEFRLRIRRAELFEWQARYADGLADLAFVIEEHRHKVGGPHFVGHLHSARLSCLLGKIVEAGRHLAAAGSCTLDDSGQSALASAKGLLLFAEGHADEADRVWRHAVQLHRSRDSQHLSEALSDARLPKKSLRYDFVRCHLTLGECALARGDSSSAVRHLSRAATLRRAFIPEAEARLKALLTQLAGNANQEVHGRAVEALQHW